MTDAVTWYRVVVSREHHQGNVPAEEHEGADLDFQVTTEGSLCVGPRNYDEDVVDAFVVYAPGHWSKVRREEMPT